MNDFVKLANSYPKLTPAEELALAVEARAGSKAAREKLACANLRYVVQIAHKFRRFCTEADDLYAAGNEGLTIALNKFDPARGLRFITYASHWIRAKMLRYILRNLPAACIASSNAFSSRLYFKLKRLRAQANTRFGNDHEAVMAFVEHETGISRARLEELYSALDAVLAGPHALGDVYVEVDLDPEQLLSAAEGTEIARMRARHAIDAAELSPRQLQVLELLWLTDDPLDSFAEAARVFGVSRERIRQHQEHCFRKIREQLAVNPLHADEADVI